MRRAVFGSWSFGGARVPGCSGGSSCPIDCIASCSFLDGSGVRSGEVGFRAARTVPTPVPTAFVTIPAGSFTLGPSPGPDGLGRFEAREENAPVTLTCAFSIGPTELTQGQWKAMSGGVNPSRCQPSACSQSSCTGTESANE
jgi:hypothetical protein